jgi:hypothetical protein
MAVTIHPLAEQDLPAAARIIRVAFGTFIGVPEPEQFWLDLDYAHSRWHAVTDSIYPGLEVEREIQAVQQAGAGGHRAAVAGRCAGGLWGLSYGPRHGSGG